MASSDLDPRLAELLAHHENLTDARPGYEFNSETKLAALHQPNENSQIGRLLTSLNGIASPGEPCTLMLEDGTVFDSVSKTDGYRLSVTFNNLWAAPAIRLACTWDIEAGLRPAFLLTLAVEFHFKSVPGTVGIGETFKTAQRIPTENGFNDEMSFITLGAARCEGFKWLDKYGTHLGDCGSRLAETLRRLTAAAGSQKIRLRYSSNAEHLTQLLQYLPGGDGPLLPTFTEVDWSMYRTGGSNVPAFLSPHELVNDKIPHLWLPHKSLYTFATPTEAAIELGMSAIYSHHEQEQALLQWAAVQHKGTPYRIGNIVVMAVTFDRFNRLRGRKFQPPENLDVVMTWTDYRTKKYQTCPGRLSSIPISLPDEYDAIFTMRPKVLKSLLKVCYDPENGIGEWSAIDIKPHLNKFTLESQLYTARSIVSDRTKRWRPFILNQLLDDLQPVDIAKTRVPGYIDPLLEVHVEEGYQWLLHWRQWNAEQLDAINSIRYAIGGIIIVCGPAGSGKTLVQLAICVFLYRLGFHILALAPANSNCADFMRKVCKYFPDVGATRVFPASTDITLKDTNQKIEAKRQAGHVDGAVASLYDFEMVRAETLSHQEKYASFRHLGVQEGVLDAARRGSYTLCGYLRNAAGDLLNDEEVDFWAVLKNCIEVSDGGDVDLDDMTFMSIYASSYRACVGHYVALSPFIVTTTGNVRCSEIVNNWGQEKYGTTCPGIFIMLDEAFKGAEIDSLTALLSEEWEDRIIGMMMLGDEKQLEPVNRSSRSDAIFNPYPDRQSISWPSRLIHEGFPYVELIEQHRMNHHISEWPSKRFYAKGIRNAPEMYSTLKDKSQGLYKCLLQFFRARTGNHDLNLDDGQLRTHYLEINGVRAKDAEGCSKVVLEHIKVFFETIFWDLHEYYGKAMEKNVMIIVAYRESRKRWREAASSVQSKYKLSEKDTPTISFLPKVNTIDSSQGQEAPVVFLDCSVQKGHIRRRDLGFVDDDKRMNVAMTRAKEVFYVLGGPCRGYLNEERNPPAYISYKQDLESKDRCLKMNNKEILDRSDWMPKLNKKPEINLTARYSDDVRKRKQGDFTGKLEDRRIMEWELYAADHN